MAQHLLNYLQKHSFSTKLTWHFLGKSEAMHLHKKTIKWSYIACVFGSSLLDINTGHTGYQTQNFIHYDLVNQISVRIFLWDKFKVTQKVLYCENKPTVDEQRNIFLKQRNQQCSYFLMDFLFLSLKYALLCFLSHARRKPSFPG